MKTSDILFPHWVKGPTECNTFSRTFFVETHHGRIRKVKRVEK